MAHSFRHAPTEVERQQQRQATPDDLAARTLDAIRSHCPASLEACIRKMTDRQSFFSMHCAELAQAALSDVQGDCMAVLLKTGMCRNAEFIRLITIDGNFRQQQVLREFTDKGAMVQRWMRESSDFCQKFRYKIKSVF